MFPDPERIQIILPVLSCIFLVLSFHRCIYGVIAYFIILNAKLGDMYPVLGAIRFELLAAVVVFASILQTRGFQNVLPKPDSLNKPLWIYFTLGMISVPLAVDIGTSWENGGYTLLKLMLFYIMVVSSIENTSDLAKIVWAMILISGWIAYEPFYNFITGNIVLERYGEIAYGRFGAATGHVALANTLSQAVPIAFYWAISQKGAFKTSTVYILLSLLVLGVVISKSRGGFVGLVAIAAGITYQSKSRGKTAVILIACFFLLLPLAGTEYLNRISTITGGISQSRSTSDRYEGLVHGISMLIKRPLLGVGIGCYAEARRRFFHYYFYAHNLYGELFGELGIASISWFVWIYMIFKKSNFLKTRLKSQDIETKRIYNLLCAVQVGLFTRLVIGNFSHCQLIWFWFFMAGITQSIYNLTDVDITLAPQETNGHSDSNSEKHASSTGLTI